LSTTTVELSKAIISLEEVIVFFKNAQPGSAEQKAFRDACIQRFEYCIELSWKVSMKTLGSSTAAAKPAIREMARNNLINDPSKWIDFIDARNNSSHSYDEDIAKKVYTQIEEFLPEAQSLLSLLQKF
jgi:nucleotidyltransferase substrate binding protein (TIGR01987 family)